MIAGRQERDSLGRHYGKVPLDFFDRLPAGQYSGAALPVYLCPCGYSNRATHLAWPLVCTACERIDISPRTWKGATATLKDAGLIRKAKWKPNKRDTIAYQVKPIDGRYVEVEDKEVWQEDDWTMLHTYLAWERFSVSGWRLLLRLAYHDRRALKVAEWAAEAGVKQAKATPGWLTWWLPGGLRT